MKGRIVLATRKSALALAQARAWARDFTAQTGVAVSELHVTTTGDRITDRALNEVGGKGLFIKEIEEALLAGEADIAVHSLKDVPAQLAPSLMLACFPEREDARDVLITRTGCSLAELPPGSRIGTSSLRRRIQLQLVRPDVQCVVLRGNVDTRLRRCEEGVVDAIVLAHAGLRRLGLAARATQVLEPELLLPAVGQGSLAIECRTADQETQALLQPLRHSETSLCVAAERGVMQAVDGNCQVPVAAYALRTEQGMWLRGLLANDDGSNLRRQQLRAPWPESEQAAFAIGQGLGQALRTA